MGPVKLPTGAIRHGIVGTTTDRVDHQKNKGSVVLSNQVALSVNQSTRRRQPTELRHLAADGRSRKYTPTLATPFQWPGLPKIDHGDTHRQSATNYQGAGPGWCAHRSHNAPMWRGAHGDAPLLASRNRLTLIQPGVPQIFIPRSIVNPCTISSKESMSIFST